MTLYLIAFFGGMLTLLSPCILPVLPFVFSRGDRPLAQGSGPLLAGLAAGFAAVASLGAVAGAWAVRLNQYGRWVALASLALFAASLLMPRLANWWSRPLVRAGERLARIRTRSPWLTSALLGVATGLIWSPCAGPVLGLVLSTAALGGPDTRTSLLLLSYGSGAAVALWAALRLGTGAWARWRPRWVPAQAGRRIAGAAMLAAVAAVAAGLDTTVLANVARPVGAGLEARLLQGAPSTQASLEGGTRWLNGEPRSIASLRGKVVLVNFWTYSCVNCLRTLPYVKAWADKYAGRGLVVVGVHTPEFAFEKESANVQRALRDLKIPYPVVQDNEFRIWRAFGNQYWPALYLIDAQGRVRHHQFGEGGYAASERAIEELLRESGAPAGTAAASVQPELQGTGVPADPSTLRSPETYLGYEKGAGPRVGSRAVADMPVDYRPAALPLNTWSLAGPWTLRPEWAEANAPGAALAVRFQARDANLVLGKPAGPAIRFRVLLDGKPPGPDHGADVDAEGNGVLDASRLYQLVRQRGEVKPRELEIRFLDPGARGYAFTFG
jgi:cytochrome c biogenesis protein CcdA/thiol-disulfide isomerase/thioredoxin